MLDPPQLPLLSKIFHDHLQAIPGLLTVAEWQAYIDVSNREMIDENISLSTFWIAVWDRFRRLSDRAKTCIFVCQCHPLMLMFLHSVLLLLIYMYACTFTNRQIYSLTGYTAECRGFGTVTTRNLLLFAAENHLPYRAVEPSDVGRLCLLSPIAQLCGPRSRWVKYFWNQCHLHSYFKPNYFLPLLLL